MSVQTGQRRDASADLLPHGTLAVLDGRPAPGAAIAAGTVPGPEELLAIYRAMVLGRAVEEAATVMARQGMMGAYPAARGQEACQVGAALALATSDWLFPTYRDSIAVMTRGVDPAEVLAGPLGRRHLGYDPRQHRVAPLCTPLATHAPHAVGLAFAAGSRGEPTVAMVLLGDGATSEGDFHAAATFAAVWQAPVVFLVQNNGYAISVPAQRQCAAPSFAHKGIGYGIPGLIIDGNDVLAVLLAARSAVERARAGGGPTLIEARTYRIGPHTSADDPSRYRTAEEAEPWRAIDPVERLADYLTATALLGVEEAEEAARVAGAATAKLRLHVEEPFVPDPAEVAAHVYTRPPQRIDAWPVLVDSGGDRA